MHNPSETKVSGKYGAPMGRTSVGQLDGDQVTLSNVIIDSQGYDEGGAYWGSRQRGKTLFVAWSEGDVQYFDARSWSDAKRHLLYEYGIEHDRVTIEKQESQIYSIGYACECGELFDELCEHDEAESSCPSCGAWCDAETITDTETETYTPYIPD